EYPELQSQLLTDAVRHLIHDLRHTNNCRLKKESGGYDVKPKVLVGDSTTVRQSCLESYYNYFVGGMPLGDCTREDLQRIGENERNIANGHLFNYALCNSLIGKVQDGKTVRECVKESALKKMFAKLQNGHG